jgi:hypothetical protein
LSYLRPPGWWPSAFRTLVLFQKESTQARSVEDCGRFGDPGADSRLEVAPHPGGDGCRAAVRLEALEVESELFDPLPEVRVIDVTAVGVERVDQLEEATLPARGLGGGVQSRRAWVLAGDREVTKDDRRFALADLGPGRGAVRAAEVGVDDQLRPLSPAVVVRAGRGDRGAGQLRRQC